VSLAGADLAVAILVMPFNAANFVANDGDWKFGSVWCNIWLTLDILCCTASILHLCAIAIDRYYAIHDPINYAVQRTYRRVLFKIGLVWVASAVISIPPLIGWNNSSSQSLYDELSRRCQLTDELSFVIYSACGSFYIPLVIMSFVYAQIYRATRARLRARVNKTSKKLCLAAPSGFASTVAITPVISDDASAWVNEDHKERRAVCGEIRASIECKGHSSNGGGINSGDIDQGISPPATVQKYLHPSMHNLKRNDDVICVPHRLTRTTASRVTCTSPGVACTSPGVTCTSPRVTYTPPVSTNGLSAAHETQMVIYVSTEQNTRMNEMNRFALSKQKISLTKERRAARTMGIIMGAFVVCWLPFFLMYVIFAFCELCAASVDKRLVNFIVWLGYINSALNPIIYTIFNIDFRKAFQNLVFSRCCPASN